MYVQTYINPRDACATSHPTNATRLNHFSTSFHFFNFHKNHKTSIIFSFFPPKGTLTLTPGMGVVVGGPFRTPEISKHLKQSKK